MSVDDFKTILLVFIQSFSNSSVLKQFIYLYYSMSINGNNVRVLNIDETARKMFFKSALLSCRSMKINELFENIIEM